MVHDSKFWQWGGFQIADGDELRVSLDGGFSEDKAAFGGYSLAGVVFDGDALVDAEADVDKVAGGDIVEFGLADEGAVEEKCDFAGE